MDLLEAGPLMFILQVAGRHEELIRILWCPCSYAEGRTTVLCVPLGSAEKASLIT